MRTFRLLLLAGLTVGAALPQPQAGPALAIDAAAARHSISPDIYGLNQYFMDETVNNYGSSYWNLHPDYTQLGAGADLRIGSRRWGGNLASRYDWNLDLWNAANDWFFTVSGDLLNPHPELLPEGSRFNMMMEYTRMSGGKMMGSVSVLEWLPNVRPPGSSSLCSYSVAKYGPQLQVDPTKTCGNGITPDGKAEIQNDPSDIATRTDENYQRDWIKYVVSKYGTADQGGVAIWSLDNEPMWWGIVHRDIHPQQQTYDETLDRGIRYATAIKEADPAALVTGPVSASWPSFFFSTADLVGAGLGISDVLSGTLSVPFWRNPVDRNAHGGVDFSSWYLQQFKAYEDQHHQRLLDYFDLHFYSILAQPANDQERLRSTRVLWDPAFVATDPDWGFDEQGQPAKPRLIPRMRDWVNQNYPGTKTALTEYDFGAHKTIVGALVQADVLGIFGREGLDLATAFLAGMTNPPGDPLPAMTFDPIAYAFRMYRNYDGIGGAFGETSVQATTGDPDQLSIFAAQRSDTALTILVLNKSTSDLSSTISISSFTPDTKAQVWRYSQANLTSILRQPDASPSGASIAATFPSYSMTLLVVPAAPSVLPVPKPVVAAVVDAASYGAATAPGQMVVVWGSNLGPEQLDSHIVAGSNSMVATVMDNVRILFDGVPAPLVYVSQGQCAAVIPYLAGLKPVTNVQVEVQGVRSDPFSVAVAPTAPGLFTANAQGRGQAAMQNQDGITPNSSLAPAPPGSVVVLWGTGEGATNPPGVDGRLAIDILPKPIATCAAEIGGLPARVEYCGAAPLNMPGLFQVNARMDPSVAPGDAVPVRVILGGKPSQGGVTMVVR
jgi:uncharacterized protein (TIGR03437 family)